MEFITRSAFCLFLVGAVSIPCIVRGQQSDMTIVHLWADAPLSIAQEKQASEHLLVLDPDRRFSVQPDRQRLKVGFFLQVTVESVQVALAQAGVSTAVIPTSTSAVAVKSGSAVLHGFPVFINTGNPGLDDQNYQTAKAAWIQAHPDAYQQAVGAPSPQ